MYVQSQFGWVEWWCKGQSDSLERSFLVSVNRGMDGKEESLTVAFQQHWMHLDMHPSKCVRMIIVPFEDVYKIWHFIPQHGWQLVYENTERAAQFIVETEAVKETTHDKANEAIKQSDQVPEKESVRSLES